MAWYTVTVMMTCAYSVEADTKEQAEWLVQNEFPHAAESVSIISVEEEETCAKA
jgi:hypothetical protein